MSANRIYNPNTIWLNHYHQEIKLLEGESIFDAIFNNVDIYPETIKVWDISEKDEALKTLAEYRSTARKIGFGVWLADAYALEFCETDSDGEFVNGSDFEPAEEIR